MVATVKARLIPIKRSRRRKLAVKRMRKHDAFVMTCVVRSVKNVNVRCA